MLRSTNNNLGAEIVGDTAGPLAEISQWVLGRNGSKKQVERAINRDLATRMRNMHERCYREGIDPDRLANPCAEVEAVLDTIGDHKWMLEQAVHDPDALRTDFKERALKQRVQVDERLVPHFDELINAVVEQYIDYAELSPNYLRVAAKQSLKNDKESRESTAKILDAVDDVRHMVGKFASSDSKPSRVFFGSRPDVVAGERFVERDEQKHLNELIVDPTIQRTVLVGMRGCGKTQLAASLAQQCEDANWNLVAWINAVSRESIQSDLVELAKQLGIGTIDQPTQDQVIRSFLSRMKSAKPADRLIIFDNVEDINHLTGLIPSGDGVRVVATTTNKVGWEDQGWNSIKVGVFDRSESINYLLTVTKSDDRDAANALAERLGDLPLAIAQAAATARNKDLSLARYLQQLDSRCEELVIRPIPGDEYTVDAVKALLMAVKDTIEGLEGNTKETAQRQLGALALLAESGVPTRWLDPTVEQLDDDESPDTQRDTDEDAHDALTELIHRSIVQQSTDKATTMLHRLQAQALRESWNEQDNKEALESAAALLRSVSISKFSRNATALRRRETLDLIEQLRAIGEQTHSQLLFTLRTITASLFQGFSHAHDLGLACAALTLEISANSLENTPALDPHERLNLHICLAQAYQAAGNLPKAIYRYRQVLGVCTRTFGKGDPRTLSCRNYLASAYQAAGNLPEAIYLYEQVLRDTPPIVGKYHPNTLNTRISLASAYQEVGDIHKAIYRYKQVYKDCIKALGENHPETLRSRINLAYAYQEAGDVDKAISSYEQLLQDCTRILGQEHPHTLATRNNLASAYESAGHKAESISSYEQLSRTAPVSWARSTLTPSPHATTSLTHTH